MLREKKCGGDCDSCRRGCGEHCSPNVKPRTEYGSDLEEIRKLGNNLSERYTARSLVDEISRVCDPNYLAFFGISGATASYLTHFNDRLGLHIAREDIRKMAEKIVERGDITF